MKEALDNFKHEIRCKPWKLITMAVGTSLAVTAVVFPPAAVAMVVAGLVNAAVRAAFDAAEEPCKEERVTFSSERR